jgi:UrcA family protein
MRYNKALGGCGPILVAAFAATLASPAQGRAPAPVEVVGQSEQMTREVSYADLDLASATGRKTLDGRVGAAVNDLCKQVVGRDDLSTSLWCASAAWESAWPQVARADRRAREMAETGGSSIVAAAITIDVGR